MHNMGHAFLTAPESRRSPRLPLGWAYRDSGSCRGQVGWRSDARRLAVPAALPNYPPRPATAAPNSQSTHMRAPHLRA